MKTYNIIPYRKIFGFAAVAVLILGPLIFPRIAIGDDWTLERASVGVGGTNPNEHSQYPRVSADGRYVVFNSNASNLVPNDTNGVEDVFVRDRQAGTTEIISVSATGAVGNGPSQYCDISADGRFVVFWSNASNFPGDTDTYYDVFLRDRQTKTTVRITQQSDTIRRIYDVDRPSLSADGRYVVFSSYAANLVAGDTNTSSDIFVYDRASMTTERVSVASNGTQANSGSNQPLISADGSFVVFRSAATNLVTGDTNNCADIFVRDRQTGATERVNVSTAGAQASTYSLNGEVSMSADGRYVAFWSDATNLMPKYNNNYWNVYVRDRQARITEIISVATDGTYGNKVSNYPTLSSDGRYCVFYSEATNLAPGDTNGVADIYLRDRVNHTTERISVAKGGQEPNDDCFYPCVSADGNIAAFESYASNLVPNDTNNKYDIFISRRILPDPSIPVVENFSVTDADTGDNIITDARTINVSLSATDQGGTILKYLITESPEKPLPQDFMLTSPPATYELQGADLSVIDLYAWVLDSNGNINAQLAPAKDSIFLDLPPRDVKISYDPNFTPPQYRSILCDVRTAGEYVYVLWKDNSPLELNPGSGNLFISRSADGGKTWNEPIKASSLPYGSGTGTGGYPIGNIDTFGSTIKMATDDAGQYVYIVWTDDRTGKARIYFNYSKDYGITWQPEDSRVDHNNNAGQISNCPRIACDNNGHVYVIWKDWRNNTGFGTNKRDLYLNTINVRAPAPAWRPEDILADHDNINDLTYTGVGNCYEVLCDDSGRVYVAWEDYRTYRTGMATFFNCSEDRGNTWVFPQDKQMSSAGGQGIEMACSKNGKVYVGYFNGGAYVARYYYEGNQWRVANGVPLNIGSYITGLSADDTGDNVYVVGHDYYDVEVNYSYDSGVTWQTGGQKVNIGSNGIWPVITSDNNGNVYVAWWQARPGITPAIYDLYFNYSIDFGATFQPIIEQINSNEAGRNESAQSDPGLGCDQYGRVYIGWHDNRVVDVYEIVEDGVKVSVYIARNNGVSMAPKDIGVYFGDVDLNKNINAQDALEALKHAAMIQTLTGRALLSADADNNGEVTAEDALLILKYSAGIIDTLERKPQN